MKMILGHVDLAPTLYITHNLRPADVRELEATRYERLDPDALAIEVVTSWAASSPAWIAYGDDKPVCVFGATQPWPGLWSAYMLTTDQFGEIGLPVTRFVRRVFIPHMRAHANRIEARSIDGHEEAHAWLRLLGATEECRMKGYGRAGEDFVVFTLAVGYVDNGDCRSASVRELQHGPV